MKIFLTAGHNHFDSGAEGVDGVLEAKLTIELRNLIASRIPSGMLWVDSDDWNLARTAEEIRNRSQSNDIICDLHFNASDSPTASGVEVIVPWQEIDRELNLAARLATAIAETLNIPNRGVKKENETPRGRLAMMRPDGINVLIETCFITHAGDLAAYQANKGLLAQAIAMILMG